ncbi:MAG: hypothetical protein KGL74_14450 [Elusimicrobia bacterium]|nr:hypothetical protein [Elusimicrobiota bacterium]
MKFSSLAAIVLAPLLVRPASAMGMTGMYGSYSMTREASGTSWQPESTPHEGLHLMEGDWRVMIHGYADAIDDRQGGPRGADKNFSESMLMAMAQRPLGPGTFGLRGMVSLDPLMGKSGYPLLLQTGETANGRDGLIDRQHPHDLFMEMAAAYSCPLNEDSSVFGYFGLPGEPALGPAAFMHRASGMDNPEAPITHHWLDSSHVTFGVTALGYIWRDLKLEGSAFRGREPDQYRWDIEKPDLDSYSTRLSFNPSRDWSLQVSYGHIVSPEQLTPAVNQDRVTASASVNWRAWGNPGQTTLAFGRDRNRPGRTLDAYLLESEVHIAGVHTVFGRAERVQKDELFDGGPLAGSAFAVGKVSLGYIYDFPPRARVRWGLGGVGSVIVIPEALKSAYGSAPTSFMLFLRAKII